MKKICLMFNHLQHQDGVARSAVAIAIHLTRMHLAEVTLMPLFRNDKKAHALLDAGVKVKPIFGYYFKGFSWLVHKLPMGLFSRLVFGRETYDIEVAFQYGISQRCVAAHRSAATKYAWMHGYDYGLRFKHEYEKIGTVCCVSRCNAERLHKELPSVKVDYNYNPIDDTEIRAFGREPIEIERPEGLLFVTVGRHSTEKGFDRLIKIVKRLKDERYKFHLWIIGDGPQSANLHQLRTELGVEEEVQFLGRQNNPHKFTSKADVFICSSFREGYSTACTEAIMLGVPVVTTNVSGAEEIISEAGCGMLTEMDDESLYKAIKSICETPTVVDVWKRTLLKTRERFSVDVRIQRLVKLFQLNE